MSKVYLIASTQTELWQYIDLGEGMTGFGLPGKAFDSEFERRIDLETDGPEHVIEFAGRLCYESFDLPSDKTRDGDDYIKNIIKLGHLSVLEHASVTFYIEKVSRNFTHELIRHRHLSPSELSQRYVDLTVSNFVIPPAIRTNDHVDHPNDTVDYQVVVEDLVSEGMTRKQAREAARYYLQQGTETKIVVTGNLRTWREILPKRLSPKADAEMQSVMREIRSILVARYPAVFGDINEDGTSTLNVPDEV